MKKPAGNENGLPESKRYAVDEAGAPIVVDNQPGVGGVLGLQALAAFRSELAKYAALVKKVGLEPQ